MILVEWFWSRDDSWAIKFEQLLLWGEDGRAIVDGRQLLGDGCHAIVLHHIYFTKDVG